MLVMFWFANKSENTLSRGLASYFPCGDFKYYVYRSVKALVCSLMGKFPFRYAFIIDKVVVTSFFFCCQVWRVVPFQAQEMQNTGFWWTQWKNILIMMRAKLMPSLRSLRKNTTRNTRIRWNMRGENITLDKMLGTVLIRSYLVVLATHIYDWLAGFFYSVFCHCLLY